MARNWQPVPDEELVSSKVEEPSEVMDKVNLNPVVWKSKHGRVFCLRFLNDYQLAQVLDELMETCGVNVTAVLSQVGPSGTNWLIQTNIPGNITICVTEPEGLAWTREGVFVDL